MLDYYKSNDILICVNKIIEDYKCDKDDGLNLILDFSEVNSSAATALNEIIYLKRYLKRTFNN
jgi:hypothetical protein